MAWLRSLTLRLTLLFAAASTTVLILIGVAFYFSLGTHFLHEDAIELQGKIELLGNLVRRVETEGDLPALAERLQDALVGHHNLALDLATPDGRVVYSDAAMPALPNELKTRIKGDRVDGLRMETIAADGHEYRVVRFELPTKLATSPDLRATLAMNIDHHRLFMARVLDTTIVFVMLGIVSAAAAGWMASRAGLAPLRGFASLATRTSAERLDARIDVASLPTELVPLGNSFNAMLHRLEASFARLREFSSDLAHELRTPVSALRTQAEVALSRARTDDEYRDVLYSAVEEYDRLTRTVNDMLFLAKSDHGLIVPNTDTVDLRSEVLALFDFYDALVESKHVHLDVSGSATIEGDRLMLRRALSNLLSNAIRHAKPESTVTVELRQSDQDRVTVVVSNMGDLISEEHLPRLFDRFYRVDPARARTTEGAGLGLAITKSIVDAHRGTITASSTNAGTRITMQFPASMRGGNRSAIAGSAT